MRNINQLLKIITVLSDGQLHSGEAIGAILGMSRSAINKYVKTLRSLGIHLTSVPNRGYQLSQRISLLDEKKIAVQCNIFNPKRFYLIPIIDSTNQFLLNRIEQLDSATVCVAEYQYNGRGRRGRSWFSPFGTNLYFSMYWKFAAGPLAVTGLSLVVGIAIAKVLRQLSGKAITVKWPNDLYLDDKKLAGILVDMVGRSGDDLHVVIGVGINLMMQLSTPEVIDQKWIKLGNIDRNQLVAKLISSLSDTLVEFEQKGLVNFINEWNELDNFINRPIKLIIGDETIYGISQGINEQGAILLQQEEGCIKPYIGGEISLRAND